MSWSAIKGLKLTLALLTAALLQGVYAESWTIFGARPDILLATLIIAGLNSDTNNGSAYGFYAGLMHASLAAPPRNGFGSLIVSRTVIGFLAGWFENKVEREHPLIVLGFVTLGTLLTELLFFALSPQRTPFHWFRNACLTTLFNAVIAIPLFYAIRFLIGKSEDGVSRF